MTNKVHNIVIAVMVICFIVGFFIGKRFTGKCVVWAFTKDAPVILEQLCKL